MIIRKAPWEIVCNPSDPEATLDGHKGSGYIRIQLSETCTAHDNEVPVDRLCHCGNCLPDRFRRGFAVVI